MYRTFFPFTKLFSLQNIHCSFIIHQFHLVSSSLPILSFVKANHTCRTLLHWDLGRCYRIPYFWYPSALVLLKFHWKFLCFRFINLWTQDNTNLPSISGFFELRFGPSSFIDFKDSLGNISLVSFLPTLSLMVFYTIKSRSISVLNYDKLVHRSGTVFLCFS